MGGTFKHSWSWVWPTYLIPILMSMTAGSSKSRSRSVISTYTEEQELRLDSTLINKVCSQNMLGRMKLHFGSQCKNDPPLLWVSERYSGQLGLFLIACHENLYKSLIRSTYVAKTVEIYPNMLSYREPAHCLIGVQK